MPINRLSPAEFGSIIDNIEYQKPYLFYIHLPEINLSDSAGGMGGKKLKPSDSFELCTASTAFPVMTSAVQTIAFYNSELKIPTKTTYGNWDATFRLDLNNVAASMGISVGSVGKLIGGFIGAEALKNVNIPMAATNSYNYFYYWQLAAFDPKTRVSYLPSTYKKSVDLVLLNELGKEISGFTMEGAFPVSISGGNLNYGDDGILTYTVSFAFDRFLVTDYANVNVQSPGNVKAEELKKETEKKGYNLPSFLPKSLQGPNNFVEIQSRNLGLGRKIETGEDDHYRSGGGGYNGSWNAPPKIPTLLKKP